MRVHSIGFLSRSLYHLATGCKAKHRMILYIGSKGNPAQVSLSLLEIVMYTDLVGKSTLVKFAMRNDKLFSLLDSTGHHAWIVAPFFFRDRGAEIQKSLPRMFQEVLASILRQIPSLMPDVVPFFNYLVQSQKSRKPSWTLDMLESALLAVMKQCRVEVRILLLLDALDEHQRGNDRLALLLKKLKDSADNKYVHLKLCLASRSWIVFEQHFGRCLGLTIHNHMLQDVRTYIEAKVNVEQAAPQSVSTSASLQCIVNSVAEKALGVIIWVRLATDFLAKGIRDGIPFATLENEVARMPQELKDLYADTLRRIEPEYSTEAYIMLQMVLCSDSPLPIDLLMASVDRVLHWDSAVSSSSKPIDSKFDPPNSLRSRNSSSEPTVFDDQDLSIYKS